MAEVIGIASGIAGLLSLVVTVFDVSCRYVSNARGSSKCVDEYLKELTIFKNLLIRLDELTHNQEPLDVFTGNSSTLLSTLSLDDCHTELEELLLDLQRRARSTSLLRGIHALSWPFSEKETRRIIERLHRYRSFYETAFSADAWYLL